MVKTSSFGASGASGILVRKFRLRRDAKMNMIGNMIPEEKARVDHSNV
jgi:hypothetical protein